MGKENKKNYVLELKLNVKLFQRHILEKRFLISEKIYNKTLSYALKNYKELKENKYYRNLLKEYFSIKNYKKPKNEEKIITQSRDKRLKVVQAELKRLRLKYHLSEYELHKYVKNIQKSYKKHIDSSTTQKIATTVFGAVNKLIFDKDTKKVKFKKYGSLSSVEGKSNKTGIRYNIESNLLSWNNLILEPKIRKNDLFVKESLENSPIKYCRIVRKPFKTGYKYFLQLVLGGTPPPKRINANGEFRHLVNTTDSVGIDIAPQTIAFVSPTKIDLRLLATYSSKYDKEINKLKRKLQRSRYLNNLNNYNENKTIKKGIKLRWVRTKNYIKTLFKLKHLYRLKSNYVKLEHNKLSNELLSLGTNIYVETMSFNKLKAKSKIGRKNKKGKNLSKKRFGKSIQNKSPSLLLSIIDKKLNYLDKNLFKVDTYSFRASQLNHIDNTYCKKPLSKRWSLINNIKIQRDLYSAFLLMNSLENLKNADLEKCNLTYDSFLKLHNTLIKNMENDKIKYPSSFGIRKALGE